MTVENVTSILETPEKRLETTPENILTIFTDDFSLPLEEPGRAKNHIAKEK